MDPATSSSSSSSEDSEPDQSNSLDQSNELHQSINGLNQGNGSRQPISDALASRMAIFDALKTRRIQLSSASKPIKKNKKRQRTKGQGKAMKEMEKKPLESQNPGPETLKEGKGFQEEMMKLPYVKRLALSTDAVDDVTVVKEISFLLVLSPSSLLSLIASFFLPFSFVCLLLLFPPEIL